MRFAHPQILWLLLVLPSALALFLWRAMRVREELLAQFIEARLLSQLTVGISPARRKLRFIFLILAVAFLVIAIAQPEYGYDLQEVEQHGLDIVIAIDTSRSMLTQDIAPDRLERAKLAALELMQDAKADRLGLVAFAGEAFLECPLTVDNTAFQQSVQALNVDSIPEGGTSLESAIDTSLAAFKEGANNKVLVLLTDGEDNVDEAAALQAAQSAAKAGLKIFTIGIGTAAGDLIRVTDANGNTDYVRDEQGNVVKSHLNAPLLQKIAGATGGFYLPLQGADTMDVLYERGLAPLPKSESEEKLIRLYHEQYQWPLTAAILLLLAEMFLPERRRGPKTTSPIPKIGGVKIAVLAMAVCLLPNLILASPSDAMRAYNTGNYTNAMQEFDQLAEVNTNDLRLVFDAGTAAYRATNYDAALSDFQVVAAAPDLKLQQQAYYNLGDTLYRMGESKFEPDTASLDAMEQTWQQAIKSYQRAAELNTNDVDAAYNLAFVKRQIASIAQLREMMRRVKLEADDAVRRDEYHQALEIIQSLNNPIASKKFQDYTKKLKDIDAIVTPHQP